MELREAGAEFEGDTDLDISRAASQVRRSPDRGRFTTRRVDIAVEGVDNGSHDGAQMGRVARRQTLTGTRHNDPVTPRYPSHIDIRVTSIEDSNVARIGPGSVSS